ncbi:MAG: hypothetical protein RRX95_05875 [Oscillospiraceae bacterium]
MNKKMESGHERAMLLKALMKVGYSESLDCETSKAFKNLGGGEISAKQITSIINSSETEAEILEKLKAL